MRKTTLLLAVLLLLSVPVKASAETLSWDPVTRYTDNTAITAPVTYTAWWTTDQTLRTGLTVIPPAGTSNTSVTFDVATAGMPRGTTIYFTANAIVQGVPSSLATPLSWQVPLRTPANPTNLRLQ